MPSAHPPVRFSYTGFARDFPAKNALEYVLGLLIDAKRNAMANASMDDAIIESGFAILDEADGTAEGRPYPNRDIWLRFKVTAEGFPALVDAPVPLIVDPMDDAVWGQDSTEGDGTNWVTVRSALTASYSSAAITFRFTQAPEGGPIACTCFVTYAEGDGEDIRDLAAHLGFGDGAT